jgi:glycosyltransferase involved in cell wall biosynthesis
VLDRITPVVLSYNEAANIGRALERLRWARQVLVVDSFSTDETVEIVRGFGNARLVQRRFDRFEAQWNFGLAQVPPGADWILAMDADYMIGEALCEEISRLEPNEDLAGYRIRFRYCIDGTPLRGSLYPPSIALFRRSRARFVQDGHTQRLHVESGNVEELREHIDHDDRKSLARWLASQERYAADEAHKLAAERWSEVSWPDRVRKVPFLAAPLVASHCLIAKGCALDGKAGLKYVGQRVIAELLISLKLLDLR